MSLNSTAPSMLIERTFKVDALARKVGAGQNENTLIVRYNFVFTWRTSRVCRGDSNCTTTTNLVNGWLAGVIVDEIDDTCQNGIVRYKAIDTKLDQRMSSTLDPVFRILVSRVKCSILPSWTTRTCRRSSRSSLDKSNYIVLRPWKRTRGCDFCKTTQNIVGNNAYQSNSAKYSLTL